MTTKTTPQPNRATASDASTPETTLVGSNFAQYPYISAYGAITRVCRLHVLPKTMLFRYLGLRFARSDSIPMTLALSKARKDQLFRHVRCSMAIRQHWDARAWLPFSSTLPEADLLTRLRVCPCCSRTGYHTMLFHLPWIDRCPWHGEQLIDWCPCCYRSLVGEFTNDTPPLVCRCGADMFSRRAASRGDSSIDRQSRTWQTSYLEWAREARVHQHLFAGPGLQGLSATDVGLLIDLPVHLRAKSQNGASPQHHVQGIEPTKLMRATRPPEDFLLTMKELPVAERAAINVPRSLLRPFRAVAQNIVEKLPPRTLFEGDLLRIYPVDDPSHLNRPPGLPQREHAEQAFLPVHETALGGVLDCTSIDKRIRASVRCIWDLAEHLIHEQGGTSIGELDLVTQNVLTALGKQILLHGYAQGIRIILSRHVTGIYDLPRDRPRPRRPIAMVFLRGYQAVGARLTWVQASKAETIEPSSRRATHRP